MNRAHLISLALALAVPALLPLPLHADDTLKVAIGQINNWENQAPTLGQDAGIFKKNGLVLETFGTAGAGETLQPIISGSADIGIGVGVAGAMRAFSNGRAGPYPRAGLHRLVGPLLVCARGFADQVARRRHRRQHRRLFHQRIELAQHRARLHRRTRPQGEADADRKPACDPDRRHVRPGRHRLGGAADRAAGGQGRQAAHHRPRQRRALAARPDRAGHRRERRPAQAAPRRGGTLHQGVPGIDGLDVRRPKALELYATKIGKPLDLVEQTIAQFYPKEVLQTDKMADMPGILRDAVKLKYLREPLTPRSSPSGADPAAVTAASSSVAVPVRRFLVQA